MNVFHHLISCWRDLCWICLIWFQFSLTIIVSDYSPRWEHVFRKPGVYDKMYGTFNEAERLEMLKLARETFTFAYDSYMKHAFPADELNPIYCKGRGPDIENP